MLTQLFNFGSINQINISELFETQFKQDLGPQATEKLQSSLLNLQQFRNSLTYSDFNQQIRSDVSTNANIIEQKILSYIKIAREFQQYQQSISKSAMPLKIEWLDSFNPNKKLMFNSMTFELSCHFYNLAILDFISGFLFLQMDAEEHKQKAILKFRVAIWAMQCVKAFQIQFSSGITPQQTTDFQLANINFLETFIRGFGSYNIYQLILKEKIKIGYNVVAAAVNQAAKYFKLAYQQLQYSKDLYPEQFYKKMSSVVQFYNNFCYALAQFHMAQYHKFLDSDQKMAGHYGRGLSYILNSKKIIEANFAKLNEFDFVPPIDIILLKQLAYDSDQLSNEMQLHNQQIYKQQVPLENELPGAPDVQELYKIKPKEPEFMQVMSQEIKNLHYFLNPEVRNQIEHVKRLILKQNSMFTEILTKFTKQKQELFKTNLLNVLEDSSVASSMSQSLPQNFLIKLTNYRNCGGNIAVNDNLSKILQWSNKCKKIFNENFLLINQQKTVEEKLLQQYQSQAQVIPKFSVMAWDELNQLTCIDIYINQQQLFFLEYYQRYEEALKVDEHCNNIYSTYQSHFQQLAKSNEDLFREYFSTTNQVSWIKQNQQQINSLRPKIREINQLMEENCGQEKQLTEHFENNDYGSQVSALLQIRKNSPPENIAKEIFQNTPVVKEFLSKLTKTKALLSELEQESQWLQSIAQQSQIQPLNQREDLTFILEQFLQVQENLKRGILFYKDLQQKLEQIYVSLKDITMTCEMTQREFVQQLMAQANQFQKQKLRKSVLVSENRTPDASPNNAFLSESSAQQIIQELPQEMQFFDPSSNQFVLGKSVFVPDQDQKEEGMMESVVVTTYQDLANFQLK